MLPTPKTAEPAKAPLVKPVSPSALLPSVTPAAVGTPGFIMVQVAAVSHQEDADLLPRRSSRPVAMPSWRAKAPGIRSSTVQVGPFNNKPAAEAMRQKLIGDGYNAMLKY